MSEVRDQRSEAEKDVRLWFVLAVGLLFLGINKQLDLQTLLIQIGREIAVSQGWFEELRRVQAIFVLLAALGTGTGLIGLVWKQRPFFQKHPMVAAGIACLALYVFIRLASIDHLPELIHHTIPDDAWWLSALEFAGTGFVSYAAFKQQFE